MQTKILDQPQIETRGERIESAQTITPSTLLAEEVIDFIRSDCQDEPRRYLNEVRVQYSGE